VGRALVGVGETAGKVADQLKTIEENSEVRRAQLEAARLRAEFAQEMEKARLDGSDYAAVEEKYQERIAERDSLAKTTKGRQAVALSQQLQKKEFFDTVNRAKLSRAVERSTQEFNEFLNIAGAGLAADPSQVDFYKAGLKNTVEAYPGLSPEQKKALYQSAAAILDEGAAKAFLAIDPEITLKALQTGDWPDMSADTRMTMVAQAKDRIHMLEQRKRTDVMWEQQKRNERGRLAHRDGIRQLAFPENEGSRKLALESAEHNVDLSDQQVKSLYAFDKALRDDERKPVVSKPAVVRQLYQRITAPYNTARKMKDAAVIAGAFIDGDLSRVDHDWLQEAFDMDTDPKGRAFMGLAKPHLESVASHIGKSTLGSPDPAGDELYARFLKRFYEEVDDLRVKDEDPRQLLDPASPNYVMNWKEAAKRGMTAIMRAKFAELGVDLRGEFGNLTAEDVAGLPELSDDKGLEALAEGAYYMYQGTPYRKPLGVD